MSTAIVPMCTCVGDARAVDRATRVRWAYLFLTRQVRRDEAARANRVHPSTFSAWVTRLVRDGEPDTDALRTIEWGN